MKKMLVLLLAATTIMFAVEGCKVEAQSVAVDLTWTAPYEDFNNLESGAVTKYNLRYSVDSVSLVNSFNTASGGAILMTPKAPGQQETYTLSGLTANTTYFVAIKSYDEVNNVSEISNICKVTTPDTTPPSAVTDLTTI